MDLAVRQEFEKMNKRVTVLEKSASDYLDAFPNKDLRGHSDYHNLMIEQIRTRKRLIELLKEKTLVALLWMAIVFAGSLLVHGLHDWVYAWFHETGHFEPTKEK